MCTNQGFRAAVRALAENHLSSRRNLVRMPAFHPVQPFGSSKYRPAVDPSQWLNPTQLGHSGSALGTALHAPLRSLVAISGDGL